MSRINEWKQSRRRWVTWYCANKECGEYHRDSGQGDGRGPVYWVGRGKMGFACKVCGERLYWTSPGQPIPEAREEDKGVDADAQER